MRGNDRAIGQIRAHKPNTRFQAGLHPQGYGQSGMQPHARSTKGLAEGAQGGDRALDLRRDRHSLRGRPDHCEFRLGFRLQFWF